jgi:sarcosine oxidase
MWRELEAEAEEPLLHVIGGLDFGRATDASLRETLAAADLHQIPVEHLTPADAMRRFPQFRFTDDMVVVYQADYGLLNASACVRAHVRLAERHGAVVVSGARVTGIDAMPSNVTVTTAKGRFSAERIVITAGSWTNQALAPLGIELPLQVQRVQYCFFRTSDPPAYRPDRFPIFISHLYDEYTYVPYSLPDYDGAGVKFAFHGGEDVSDPGLVDRKPDVDAPEKLRPFFRGTLPGVADAQHLATHICLYTVTPDHHFVIDTHPVLSNVVFATPCSGHGFKFTTLIGKILADLSLTGASQHDLSLFSHARFAAHESPA